MCCGRTAVNDFGYMQWLTNAHVRHFQALNGTAGLGHLYQGRFKNFIIQDDRHLLTVLRLWKPTPCALAS